MNNKIAITGLQSSNRLTIGNYLGSIKQIIEYQKEMYIYLFVADLHALTTWNIDPVEYKKNRISLLATYYACGIDPKKTNIFFQSEVPAHAELGWILTCSTTIGELNRMTQFKDKSSKLEASNGTNYIPTGLLVYPPLMAADILLYDSNYVIVGADQKQHVELTRDIAIRFNKKFKTNVFTIPEPLINEEVGRVMGLLDPMHKMSKSNKNENDTIFLLDDEKTITKKIMGALTDNFNKVKYNIKEQPGISNLISIYSHFTNMKIEEIEKKYENAQNYGVFKKDLAAIISKFLVNFQKKYYEILKNLKKYETLVKKNAEKCKKIANKKIDDVYKLIGLK